MNDIKSAMLDHLKSGKPIARMTFDKAHQPSKVFFEFTDGTTAELALSCDHQTFMNWWKETCGCLTFMSISLPCPNAAEYFYKMALEYYIEGRGGVLCTNSLTTGNVLHHAVEMLLKGQLSKTLPLKDLKQPKKFGHNLLKLWKAFKDHFPSEDLAVFDPMIAELEKFEEIRYPDEIIDHGAVIAFGLGTGKLATNMTSGRAEPEYQIGVGDVDAFFSRLFPLCGINPKAYLQYLSALGKQILNEGNAVSGNWL